MSIFQKSSKAGKAAAVGAALLIIGASSASAEVSDADFARAMESYLQKDENVEKIGASLERFVTKKRAEMQKKTEEAEAKTIEEQIKNPLKVDVGNSPVKGPATASITVIEFSDFQCPFCKRGADVMDELVKKYPNDVRIAFKNFPLPFHPEARGAAKAAYAAGKQGKFWEMHDKLFSSQEGLSADNYVKYATELGLNIDKFKTDMASPAAEKMIEEDMAIAQKHGIQGTPGFIVNGVQVRGARPIEYFDQLITKIKAAKK